MEERDNQIIIPVPLLSEDDVDLSQIQRNLTLSIEQRLIEHQNALDLVIELEKAGERLREKSQ